MSDEATSQLVHLLVGTAVLLGVTALVHRAAHLRTRWAPYRAVLRGGLQLAVVGAVLHGVLADAPWAAAGVLAVMFATASWTSARRLRGLEGAAVAVPLACASGALVALVPVFGLGVLPLDARYVVALGGIVLGGTMTTSSLAGRRLRSDLLARREEVEAWLSIGATPRRAVVDIARSAAREALVPLVDQTRTTGLVTLPGAFIGALLGGASPLQAARFQLVVLVALIASGSVVVVLVTTLLGAPRTLPVAEADAPAARPRRRRRR